MDDTGRLAISCYHTIAAVNSAHKVYLVQHQESQKIYIKKILDVYNLHIYEYLLAHRITGIPRLYHIYEENGQLTLIEEFISGTPLQEMIPAGTLTLDFIIRLMCELCDILEKLHALDPPIIHRDIKPSNIILTPCDHVVLIDFNAAKYLTDPGAPDTVLLGTKGYAAPEQYGFGSSTPQTDIYASGILLKELLSALPVPTNIFDPIIRKCTEMNPSDRMKNVQELKTELEKLQNRRTMKSQRSQTTARKSLALPGFRTKTPWKMLTASVAYCFIFWVSLCLEVKDATVFHLWLERITCLFSMFSVVFCCFNYRNIQRFVPLCTNENRLLRCLGILLLNFAVISPLFILMSIIETAF